MTYKRNHWFRLALFGAVILAVVSGVAQSPASLTQAQGGGTLGYGSKVYGTISAAMPLVTYSFLANPGDFVTVTADSWAGTLDLQINLIAPNGVILDTSTQNTPAGDPIGAYLSVFTSDAGIYLLRLSGENGTTGDFLLTLMGRGAVTSTPLVYGQAVDVNIPQNAPAQYYSFETENCPTTLIVSSPSQGAPFAFPFVVKVRDQRGQSVSLLRGGEQLEDWVTVQPNSGRYEVEVLSADPSLAGSIQLVVTCSGDNPGCPAGTTSIPGTAECTPCPGPDDLLTGGGCPDLNLSVQQDPHMLNATTVSWDPMPGADGYAVYVRGITTDGGEVYLTHAEWEPGNPTEFTWILPVEGYIGYQFTLEVLVEGGVLCTQQVQISIEQTSPDCPVLGLTAAVTDEAVNAVTVAWAAGLGADQFALDLYGIIGAGEEYGGRLILPGDAISRAFDHFPPHFSGVRFVLWMTRGGVLCSQEATVTFEGGPPQFTCPDLGLTASVTDSVARTVALGWNPDLGVDAFQVQMYGLNEGGETLLEDTRLPGTDVGTSFTYPEGYEGFRFVLACAPGGVIKCEAEVRLLMAVQQEECVNFSIGVTGQTGTRVDLAWPAYPEVDGYVYYLLDESRNPVPGHSVIMPATQLSLTLESPPLDPGTYIVGIGPWDATLGAICVREITVTFEESTGAPCVVRTDRQNVQVHVGPGRHRSVFTYLTPGQDYLVTGQALDPDGNPWWQLDKTQFPGHEAVTSLWVAQSDVTASGDCTQVPPAEPPPVIPEEEEPTGAWEPCGSCDTCGHPANECVTSPEGECLWDPATCLGQQPPGDGGACYSIGAAIDMGNCYGAGSAMLDTVPNCEGGQYLPGTAMQAHAVAVDSKCHVASWSGCGVSGGGASISFTATSSCTVTAHMTY